MSTIPWSEKNNGGGHYTPLAGRWQPVLHGVLHNAGHAWAMEARRSTGQASCTVEIGLFGRLARFRSSSSCGNSKKIFRMQPHSGFGVLFHIWIPVKNQKQKGTA
jgi:hypothetical protein